MQLTQFSDYSLRTLIYLGLRTDQMVTIEEIAGAYGISESHLTKVVHKLGRLNIIETVRGRRGGMRLNCRPSEVNIGATVRQMEGNLTIAECFDTEHNSCPIEPVCGLTGILGDALEAFMAVLDRYTLADILKDQPAFATLLAIPADRGDSRRVAAPS
ncbi:Rrf2 family transcriptional regulator [Dongia mobilis]|jgi:Rrf2 family nitric oxide-sensitive transcriptional repressor|uniref:RrF2 family transcriptional regulator n=1 Tax=Dongia sp. TaxID=1977262 RepID=UPI0026EEB6FC